MATFKDTFIGENPKNILIPALQRDYVQGGRIDIIANFIAVLVDAISVGKKVELNYIYGYEENNCFVPIDGQQRLTTLWLFHLYAFKQDENNKLPALKFYARDFADDFCSALSEHIQEVKKATDIYECIKNASWFITGWSRDATVENLLLALKQIHEALKDKKLEKPNFGNISFKFLNINDKGLNDSVYVKMNGRGRPLSYFENLKSWLDDEISRVNPSLKEDWRLKIDNEWTDFFWKNRNTNQEHQEDIDDEQQRLFYSLLLIYWIKNEDKLKVNLGELDDSTKTLATAFFNLSETSTNEEMSKSLLKLLFSGKAISLFWIEKFSLFNNDVFSFISNSLENLIKQNDKCSIELFFESDDNTTFMYKVAMDDKPSYAKTLPFLYCLISTPDKYLQDCGDNYKGRLRICRNLVLNINISDNNSLLSFIKEVDYLSSELTKDGGDVYENLGNLSLSKLKEDLNLKRDLFQEQEEIRKAKFIKAKSKTECNKLELLKKLEEIENYVYLKGKISVLFPDDSDDVNFSYEELNNRFELLKSFGIDDKGKFKLIRALMAASTRVENMKYEWLCLQNSKIPGLLANSKDNKGLKDCFRALKNDEPNIIPSISNDKRRWIQIIVEENNILEKMRHDLSTCKTILKAKEKYYLAASVNKNAYGNVYLDDFHHNAIYLECLKHKDRFIIWQKIEGTDYFIDEELWFKYLKDSKKYTFSLNDKYELKLLSVDAKPVEKEALKLSNDVSFDDFENRIKTMIG